MLNYKQGQLSKKEKIEIERIISEIPDTYRDFYITKNNLRIYIKENIHILYECLKKGDKIVYGEEGIVVVTGFSDNAKRKYLKILARDDKSTERLLKILFWNVKSDLWIKLKKNNPSVKVLQSEGEYEENKLKFIIKGYRGSEILLLKKQFKHYPKGDNNANENKD